MTCYIHNTRYYDWDSEYRKVQEYKTFYFLIFPLSKRLRLQFSFTKTLKSPQSAISTQHAMPKYHKKVFNYHTRWIANSINVCTYRFKYSNKEIVLRTDLKTFKAFEIWLFPSLIYLVQPVQVLPLLWLHFLSLLSAWRTFLQILWWLSEPHLVATHPVNEKYEIVNLYFAD